MRTVAHLLVSMLALVGCDYGIRVDGTVKEADGTPIPEANVYVADRRAKRGVDQYLKGDKDAPLGLGWQTDDAGEFSADRVLGGSQRKEVWLVVQKSGYTDHVEHVWSGKDGPDRDFRVDIILERVGREASGEAGAPGYDAD